MIQIGKTLLSEELLEEAFVCDLKSCKGACCVEGDAGAPLKFEEINALEENLEGILPFLPEKGQKTIQEKGVFETDQEDGEYLTTLNDGKECAFTIFDEQGIAKCGVETAYRAGKSNFKKPGSCHLYPIRIKKLNDFQALNYHRWHICEAACSLGEELGVKVYQFLKEPLIAEFGEAWFKELEEAEALWTAAQKS